MEIVVARITACSNALLTMVGCLNITVYLVERS